jgi:hypothetical protein
MSFLVVVGWLCVVAGAACFWTAVLLGSLLIHAGGARRVEPAQIVFGVLAVAMTVIAIRTFPFQLQAWVKV